MKIGPHVSGWWRIGIICCAVLGWIGFVAGRNSEQLHDSHVEKARVDAETWQPEGCDSKEVFSRAVAEEFAEAPPGVDSFQQALEGKSQVSGYRVEISCLKVGWRFRSVLNGLAYAGVVAAIGILLGWIMAGFKTREA